jgi:hypothetical protein
MFTGTAANQGVVRPLTTGKGVFDGSLALLFAVNLLIAILSFSAYLNALRIGQAKREGDLASALESERSRPIILFLRSFETGKSSLRSRVVYAAEVLFMLLGASSSAGQSSWYDVEEERDSAIGDAGIFLAIGNKRPSYGAFKITATDAEWQNTFQRLANEARLIIMEPGPSKSAMWEVSEILSSPALLEQSAFVAPLDRAFEETAQKKARKVMRETFKLRLPSQGCYYRLNSERQIIEIITLEAFTKAVHKCLKALGNDFKVANVWEIARTA